MTMTPPLQSPGCPDPGQTPRSLLVLTARAEGRLPKRVQTHLETAVTCPNVALTPEHTPGTGTFRKRVPSGRASLRVTAGLKPQPRAERMPSATR